jgi:hypothetical protein
MLVPPRTYTYGPDPYPQTPPPATAAVDGTPSETNGQDSGAELQAGDADDGSAPAPPRPSEALLPPSAQTTAPKAAPPPAAPQGGITNLPNEKDALLALFSKAPKRRKKKSRSALGEDDAEDEDNVAGSRHAPTSRDLASEQDEDPLEAYMTAVDSQVSKIKVKDAERLKRQRQLGLLGKSGRGERISNNEGQKLAAFPRARRPHLHFTLFTHPFI